MNPPKISVIMNCLNCEKYLKEAIDSIYAQTFTDWEIIFWDNASTDSSAEIAKSYDSKLKYFRGNTTIPLGEARNLAVEKAQGEYIAFLDCDDYNFPTRLEEQFNFMEENPDYLLIGSWIYVIDEDGKVIKTATVYPVEYEILFPSHLFFCTIEMPTSFLRRKAFFEVNGFDESLTLAIDYDLFGKIAAKGKVGNLPKFLAKYRSYPDNWSHKKFNVMLEETKKIILWQLEKLDIFPTESELNYQLFIPYGIQENQKLSLNGLERWYLKLFKSNKLKKVYNENAFAHVIGNFWFFACTVQPMVNNSHLLVLWNSPLFHWANLTIIQKIKIFIYMLLLKHIFLYHVLKRLIPEKILKRLDTEIKNKIYWK